MRRNLPDGEPLNTGKDFIRQSILLLIPLEHHRSQICLAQSAWKVLSYFQN